ncbi:uncharacterized protein BCR38DRAFT_487414 [Pseudomassariella vexata]|uniref:Glucose-methanol-choline oxidoreductase N-terminal domain-containing protein n=1 Tax=Pseudomassariella vexata TaxID=1141098 RepID=A0A1Y2DRA7_9PEZI|nr:uncharacterized protein BCR38DRAFT_487414 [Pseudomassariella vexata]ORY61674.1 hypothetical protein BCR38DRAFT_487414 [Pseudomassariella vexata]
MVTRQEANATSYDFIIAGSGPAGLTVADRLTEDPAFTVLVIESGPLDQGEDNVLIPGDYPPYQYFWLGLDSEPQIGLRDYDAWETLGNIGWSWDDMLTYLKKSENFTAPASAYAAEANISYTDDVHGHSGPVQGSFPPYFFPGSGNWWTAAVDSGISVASDPNGGNHFGVFAMPSFLDPHTMTRSYARINHYERIKDSRSNYHILADHTVKRVLFNENRAFGVEYLPTTGGTVSQINATKEVLLAAGGIHTPQILQLSGIGPEALLDSLEIPVVIDLPGVGQNFQDHATLTVSYSFSNNVVPNQETLDTNATYRAEQLQLYEQYQEGAFTIVHPLGTNIASLPLCNATEDCQTIAAAARAQDPAQYLPPSTDPTVLAGYEAQHALILEQLEGDSLPIGQIHWGTSTAATLYFVKPLSRGTISINTTDPLSNPVIDWRSMTNPTDLDLILALFRKNRDVLSQPSMHLLGPVEIAPFGEHLQTDDELKAVLRDQINPSNAHQCCTAQMAARELGGVLDEELKVYGVQGLRVIDISSWPMIISAAPTATMYGTGEKIADIIKKQYRLI